MSPPSVITDGGGGLDFSGLADGIGEVVLRLDDEDDAAAFLRPQLAVVRVAVGVMEVARVDLAPAGVEAAGDDVALLGAAVMVLGKPAAWRDVHQDGGGVAR